jgi:hypothetical protein
VIKADGITFVIRIVDHDGEPLTQKLMTSQRKKVLVAVQGALPNIANSISSFSTISPLALLSKPRSFGSKHRNTYILLGNLQRQMGF